MANNARAWAYEKRFSLLCWQSVVLLAFSEETHKNQKSKVLLFGSSSFLEQ